MEVTVGLSGSNVGTRIAAWSPLAILAVGAALPPVRWMTLLALVVGAGAATFRDGRRSPLAGAWLGAVAVGAVLAWGVTLAPSVALPDTSRCPDPLAPTAAARGVEAVVIIGLVVALTALHGGRDALLLRRSTVRIALLAAVAPVVIVPATLWVGPALAAPFFGTLSLQVADLRALVPAAIFALSNAALEELAYRGALLGWSTPALGLRGALVGQAVIFGLAHMGSDVTPVTAPLLWVGMALAGLIAALAAVRTRSLLLPFAVHAAVDVSLYYALACRAAG